MNFEADLDDLGLPASDADALASAIEGRAATLHAVGVSLAGLGAMAEAMVAAATGRRWPVLAAADEAAAADGRDVVILVALTEASVG